MFRLLSQTVGDLTMQLQTVDPSAELDSDSKCPETGKRHVPDWSSVTTEYDGEQCYIDVNCKDCGRSGCIGVLEALSDSIDW